MQYYVRVGSLDGYTQLVEQCGGSPFQLLEQVDLLPAQIAEPDLLIPYSTLGLLLEQTSDALQLPYFGALLGRAQGLSSIGLVGAYLVQQDSVGAALKCARKYADLHAQGANLQLTLRDSGLCELSLDICSNERHQFPQLVQMSLGLLNGIIGEMAGNRWQAEKICLRQRLSDSQQKQLFSIFGCEVETGSNRDSLWFAQSALTEPPYQPRHLLDNIIEKQFNHLQAGQLDYSKLVRHAINVLLPTGDCSKQSVALSLGIHPKKLERLLAQQSTSYRRLLEQTRKEMALSILEMKNMPMQTLALNLGYADFSAFSRSFKQWTGQAPTLYQQAAGR
ncbi:AraC family transcriptional regulator [Thalassotalea mangrovi]|uniref:AraC family transcriptional regulator n=1 Tax=Thalassotalea mangrovi TaxID=2572245 RepID=A0A4U1B7Y8_9GAMM|nr:AraC family transcriptional regulator [Thalassotalea mangrovi]TKB46606.1 AraC family transcriptional regulator [Thalassotalea mangrovi]